MEAFGVFFWIGSWFVCGLIGLYVADARGGNSRAGFWLGMLFGPLGVLISFFLKDERELELRDPHDGARKRCPDCAESVRAEAKICRFCRHEFADAAASPEI